MQSCARDPREMTRTGRVGVDVDLAGEGQVEAEGWREGSEKPAKVVLRTSATNCES